MFHQLNVLLQLRTRNSILKLLQDEKHRQNWKLTLGVSFACSTAVRTYKSPSLMQSIKRIKALVAPVGMFLWGCSRASKSLYLRQHIVVHGKAVRASLISDVPAIVEHQGYTDPDRPHMSGSNCLQKLSAHISRILYRNSSAITWIQMVNICQQERQLK